jgi:hypothetical protein
MEDAQVVDVLNVALLKLRVDAELLSSEVQGIKGFSLGFRDGWYFCAAREGSESDEVAAPILERDSLRGCLGGWQEVEQWPLRPLLVGLLKARTSSANVEVKGICHIGASTYTSMSHGWDKV